MNDQSGEDLKRLLNDPATPGDILDRLARKHKTNLSLMELVAKHPNVNAQTLVFLFNNTDKSFKTRLQEIKAGQENGEIALTKIVGDKKPQSAKVDSGDSNKVTIVKPSLLGQVLSMSVAEKVQFAFKAGKDGRSILIKDSNRQVSMAVLSSPKITEDEIVLISQSKNSSEELLRAIVKKKEWIKNYTILLSIVSNAKTPLPISLPLLTRIKTKDLGTLRRSKNVPEGIRSGAFRLYSAKMQKE